MNVNKMSKDELELMSNKDITYYLLEDSKKTINTGDLYKKIMKLLDLPEETYEAKIGDYYTSLATDKRFILLEDGTWDLRNRHTSDKIIKIVDTEEEDSDEPDIKEKEDNEEIEEDNYDDTDDNLYDDDTEDDLKDLVVIEEEDLELEQ